jgi:hypothetical protein
MTRADEIKRLLATDSIPCPKCNGTGKYLQKGFTALSGTVYQDTEHTCYTCDGTGRFNRPDLNAILAAITNTRTHGLRASKPKGNDRRAYYVWRLARFHGGADVRMPMCAVFDSGSDPYLPLLDALADIVARKAFGTDLAAAFRWGNALGTLDVPAPDGLPATAYAGGPEVLG